MSAKPLAPSLEELIEDFKQRLRSGEQPVIAEYAEKNTDLSETILDIFPTIEALEKLKGQKGRLSTVGTPAQYLATLAKLGEYRIIREIGRGGMGIVYEAVQESLGRTVALKGLPWLSQADDVSLKRFKQEAQVAASLEHPNIVPIVGMGFHEGIHYYAMRYIRGIGLDQLISHVARYGLPVECRRMTTATTTSDSDTDSGLLQTLLARILESAPADTLGRQSQQGMNEFSESQERQAVQETRAETKTLQEVYVTLPPGYYQEAANLVCQVARALHYAHSRGALHRDIKPANLLLDPMGLVWITDFGLTKTTSSETLTMAQDLIGTMRYMAPEYFKSQRDDDPRSDIYSLGLTLYELLTLQPAFSGQGGNLMYRIVKGDLKLPREVNPRIPAPLDAIVAKAVMVDPEERYQSCREIEKELADFVLGRRRPLAPQPKRQESNEKIPRKPSTRWPSLAAFIILGVAIVISFLFVRFERSPVVSPVPEGVAQPESKEAGEEPREVQRVEVETRRPPPTEWQERQTHNDRQRPRFERRPPPPAETGRLTEEQQARVKAILSQYNDATLTAEDAKAINNAFREAGVRKGQGQRRAIEAAGFDPDKIHALDPPPRE